MTLKESEAKLSELNTEISRLLKEREAVLKEWDTAYHTENPEGIVCIDESIEDIHNLYLANGDSKMHVCMFSGYDMKESIQEFYKRIDISMCMLNIANGRDSDTPDNLKNLIYARAVEIRDSYLEGPQ
ncbi:MAG: hypothetical protein HFH85_03535 [Lachnospiraceae bacterium]|nr:hypothetical protein [Lachnospiraceae bacterium]